MERTGCNDADAAAGDLLGGDAVKFYALGGSPAEEVVVDVHRWSSFLFFAGFLARPWRGLSFCHDGMREDGKSDGEVCG